MNSPVHKRQVRLRQVRLPATAGKRPVRPLAALLCLAAVTHAGEPDPTPALKPAQMHATSTAAPTTGQPRLVPVQLHAPPAVAMPEDPETRNDPFASGKWLRSDHGPPGPDAVLAPPADPERDPHTGWLTRDEQDAKATADPTRPSGSAGAGAGWLARGVYQRRSQHDQAGRDPAEVSDLDLDYDRSEEGQADAIFRRDRDENTGSWSTRGLWNRPDNAPATGYGSQPAGFRSSRGEADLALPAYGGADDDR